MATYPGLFSESLPTRLRASVPSGTISLTDPKAKLAAQLRDQYSLLVKNPAQAARTTGLASVFDTNATGASQTLTDWTKSYLASGPTAKANAAQESASVGAWYGSGQGSVPFELDKISREKNAAVNLAVQQAIGRAGRSNNILRMNRGDTSYADNQYASILANIAAQEAARQSDEQRANYMTTLEGQRAMLGQRNTIVENALNRDLVPVDTQNRMLGTNLSLLSGLAGLEDSNSLMVQNPVVPPPIDSVRGLAPSVQGSALYPGMAAPVQTSAMYPYPDVVAPAAPVKNNEQIQRDMVAANRAREAQAELGWWQNYFTQQGIQVPAGGDVAYYQNLYRQLQAMRQQQQAAPIAAPSPAISPFGPVAPAQPEMVFPSYSSLVFNQTSPYYDPNAPRRTL